MIKTTVGIFPLSYSNGTRAIRLFVGSPDYYVVELRTKTGLDSYLPFEGVIIYRVSNGGYSQSSIQVLGPPLQPEDAYVQPGLYVQVLNATKGEYYLQLGVRLSVSVKSELMPNPTEDGRGNLKLSTSPSISGIVIQVSIDGSPTLDYLTNLQGEVTVPYSFSNITQSHEVAWTVRDQAYNNLGGGALVIPSKDLMAVPATDWTGIEFALPFLLLSVIGLLVGTRGMVLVPGAVVASEKLYIAGGTAAIAIILAGLQFQLLVAQFVAEIGLIMSAGLLLYTSLVRRRRWIRLLKRLPGEEPSLFKDQKESEVKEYKEFLEFVKKEYSKFTTIVTVLSILSLFIVILGAVSSDYAPPWIGVYVAFPCWALAIGMRSNAAFWRLDRILS